MIKPTKTNQSVNVAGTKQSNLLDFNQVPSGFIDSFVNLVAGLGTSKDKRTSGYFQTREMSIDQLEAMYSDDWLSGKVVDIPVDDSTRKWRKMSAPSVEDKMKLVRDFEKYLQVKQKVNEAQKWADLYNGAIIVMIMNDDVDISEPLEPEKVKPGELSKLVVFDSTEISPMDVNTYDITAENFRLPNYYSISGGDLIHYSRVLRFEGYKLPWRLKAKNNYWGQSRLQRYYDALRNARSVIDSVASLMYEAKNDILSVPQLYQELSSPNGLSKILTRFQLGDMLKSNNNMTILDDKEKFQRIHTTFAGIADLMQKFLLAASAASDIPATRLLGQSAIGMNSTGESEERNYYDRVSSDQETKYSPVLEQLDAVMVRSAIGEFPEDYTSEFNPLRQNTETEQSDIDVKNSQRDGAYLDRGVITEAQVAQELKDNGTYSSIDDEYIDILKELEEVDELE
jgi:phage-related protein (TIGR01555 family)